MKRQEKVDKWWLDLAIKFKYDSDYKMLVFLYYDEELNVSQIVKCIGITHTTIVRRMAYYGLELRDRSQANRKRGFASKNKTNLKWNNRARELGWGDDRKMLAGVYFKTKSIKETAHIIGFSTTTISKRLKMYDIKINSKGGKRFKKNNFKSNIKPIVKLCSSCKTEPVDKTLTLFCKRCHRELTVRYDYNI